MVSIYIFDYGIGVCGVQLVPAVVLTPLPAANPFRFQFPAPAGQMYVVETSTNLPNWSPALTNAPTNGLFFYVDSNALPSQRFYRIRQ